MCLFRAIYVFAPNTTFIYCIVISIVNYLTLVNWLDDIRCLYNIEKNSHFLFASRKHIWSSIAHSCQFYELTQKMKQKVISASIESSISIAKFHYLHTMRCICTYSSFQRFHFQYKCKFISNITHKVRFSAENN